jgi:hypothetical protein
MLARLTRSGVLIALAINVCACSETFRGPDPIITAEGPAPINANSAGLVRLFFNAATVSYGSAGDPVLARQMLSDGFALIYADCSEYFRVAGRTQQRLIFGRDLLGTFGTLATGVIALAHASKDATAIAALVTATGYSVMDDIAKDFLFSADNIDSVRDITLRAIQAHQASVLAHNTVFNYDTVVLYLEDDQDYCTLRRIAALVRDAAKNAKVGEAEPGAAPTALPTGASVPATTPPPPPVAVVPPPPPAVPAPAPRLAPAPGRAPAIVSPPPATPPGIATFQHIPIRVKPLDQQ